MNKRYYPFFSGGGKKNLKSVQTCYILLGSLYDTHKMNSRKATMFIHPQASQTHYLPWNLVLGGCHIITAVYHLGV